ncbi:uncharacterized protein LOC131882818 [Tigriopus californicus]|uniref:uncharacterized protein LOC131882818 n=1 Tax=Tigriopus californicus TaxID=6832 RepID=UPI0027D9DE57|nr:uncharacterized protein LOC131882818 [Tigriopus californicus]|eukprot:TCALIF_11196-PA protein Name:"Protein of unknown function" AED:0.40 eAED:0.40 QI:0/0.33/0/0.5/1/1/4/0/269
MDSSAYTQSEPEMAKDSLAVIRKILSREDMSRSCYANLDSRRDSLSSSPEDNSLLSLRSLISRRSRSSSSSSPPKVSSSIKSSALSRRSSSQDDMRAAPSSLCSVSASHAGDSNQLQIIPEIKISCSTGTLSPTSESRQSPTFTVDPMFPYKSELQLSSSLPHEKKEEVIAAVIHGNVPSQLVPPPLVRDSTGTHLPKGLNRSMNDLMPRHNVIDSRTKSQLTALGMNFGPPASDRSFLRANSSGNSGSSAHGSGDREKASKLFQKQPE